MGQLEHDAEDPPADKCITKKPISTCHHGIWTSSGMTSA